MPIPVDMPFTTDNDKSAHILIAQSQGDSWLRVKQLLGDGVKAIEFKSSWGTFSELLSDAKKASDQSVKDYPKTSLRVPVASLKTKNLGAGLTYADHQNEVRMSKVVFFEKNASATSLLDLVTYRPYLDYEAEVAILLHRQEPELFGYFIHNDLTDRQIQVREFDEKSPAKGFSEAKSFVGANAVSPVFAVGTAELWEKLNVKLYLNDKQVQNVSPINCLLKPSDLHKQLFAPGGLGEGHDWVLIGTGTTGGTIFRAPSLMEKLGVFFGAGLSISKGADRWLNKFTYLKSGDRLRFESDVLGTYETRLK